MTKKKISQLLQLSLSCWQVPVFLVCTTTNICIEAFHTGHRDLHQTFIMTALMSRITKAISIGKPLQKIMQSVLHTSKPAKEPRTETGISNAMQRMPISMASRWEHTIC